MLPDPGHYADLLERSFADLTAATNGGRAPPKATRPTKKRRAPCRARTTART